MPLIQGASVAACKYNYSLMLKEKRNKKQAFAIMATICRANMKKVSLERQQQIRNRRFFG